MAHLIVSAGLVVFGWIFVSCVVAILVALLFVGGHCREHGLPHARRPIRRESLIGSHAR